ncbi:uncharacterized protein LOC129787156 [Lutzomyia longipalpis]|uniref:uncharacterized protein LOC129787156 n=1 Tax=Lutzomyia longipalpis TaxID=7200 RepID=UPI002483464E|nr:uncharacterized protein LOC129787156 [Lutzomyia longipalpis]
MAMSITPSDPKTLFDIPVEVMEKHVAKYLYWEDLMEFRECSRSSRDLADQMLEKLDRLFVYNYHDPAAGYHFLFRKVKGLKLIALGGLDWLTDNLLAKLLMNNPSVEVFSISNCHAISPKGILPLATHCKKLRHMILCNVQVGDNFLHTFSLHNKGLETLDLSENKDISPRWLDRFIGKQPQLRNIMLDSLWFTSIRQTLNTIARTGNNVEYLSFIGCPNIKDEDVMHLANVLPKIRAINVKVEEVDEEEDVADDFMLTEKSIEYLKSRGLGHGKTDEIQTIEDVLQEPKKAFLATYSYS